MTGTAIINPPEFKTRRWSVIQLPPLLSRSLKPSSIGKIKGFEVTTLPWSGSAVASLTQNRPRNRFHSIMLPPFPT